MHLQRLKELRKSSKLSQIEVARCLNISQRYYSDLENGRRTLSAENLLLLANFYEVSTDYLLERTSNKKIHR